MTRRARWASVWAVERDLAMRLLGGRAVGSGRVAEQRRDARGGTAHVRAQPGDDVGGDAFGRAADAHGVAGLAVLVEHGGGHAAQPHLALLVVDGVALVAHALAGGD